MTSGTQTRNTDAATNRIGQNNPTCRQNSPTTLHRLTINRTTDNTSTGIITDPTDLAMPARGLLGVQNYGIKFFH